MAIFSLANPADPVRLKVWDQNDFDAGIYGWPHSVYAKGTTAYLFNNAGIFNEGGVYQVNFNGATGVIENWKKIWYDDERGDVYNDRVRHNPELYFDCDNGDPLPLKPYTHSGWLTEDGGYILVADEHPEGSYNCQDNFTPCLRIFDVNDFYVPQSPDYELKHPVNAFDIVWNTETEQDDYLIGATAINQVLSTPCPIGECNFNSEIGFWPEPNFMAMGIHDPFVKGRLAFIAWYERGIQVLDLKDINSQNHPIYQAG
jgi:hypothetical protein